jgi:hypothetical protein
MSDDQAVGAEVNDYGLDAIGYITQLIDKPAN